MAFCSWKSRSRAISALMNVESKESCSACLRQPTNLCHNQYTAILLIKLNTTRQLRCLYPTCNPRHRIRSFSATLHKLTSYQRMLTTNVLLLLFQHAFAIVNSSLHSKAIDFYHLICNNKNTYIRLFNTFVANPNYITR